MRYIHFDLEVYRSQMEDLLRGIDKQEVFWRALDFAVEAHDDQWRHSGDAYILHPCSVAKILAEELDIRHPEILSAALLHDTVEDVDWVTSEVVGDRFGGYVQAIVEGCTKVTNISGDKQNRVKLVHRKIFSGAASKPEVMLVKLADRLHNLRTLDAMPTRKRQRIAQETIDIYAPLASVFGLFNMKREMYNLALHFKFPRQGAKLAAHIKHIAKSPVASEIIDILRGKSVDYGIQCSVQLRPKDIWAYYDTRNRILLKRIETPLEIILVVEDVQACYRALGMISQTFTLRPRSTRDFIATPKKTGYQGLHVRANIETERFLFKIRTEEMARRAQRGVLRDWDPKSRKQGQFINTIKEMFNVLGSDEELSYRDVIMASQEKEIYTYTPRGDLIWLPIGSTVLDFAFRVHTEIGETCKGAVIRNTKVNPTHVLQDGDMVRIVRDNKPVHFELGVKSLCKTPRARAELSKRFRERRRKVALHVGQSLLRQEMLRYGFPFDLFDDYDGSSRLFAQFGANDFESLCFRIGEGRVRLYMVMDYIRREFFGGKSILYPPTGVFNEILLETLDPVCVKLASCCKPNPAAKDNFMLLTDKGLSVHHKKCERLQGLNYRREDTMNVYWDQRKTKIRKKQLLKVFRVNMRQVMMAVARAPETFTLSEINMITVHPTSRPNWEISFYVPDLNGLQKVLKHFNRAVTKFSFELTC